MQTYRSKPATLVVGYWQVFSFQKTKEKAAEAEATTAFCMGCVGAGHRRRKREHKRANMSWGIGLSRKRLDPLWPYSACTIPILRNSHERASCFYTISAWMKRNSCRNFLNKEIPPLYGEEQREIQKKKGWGKIERCLIHAAVWLRTKTMAMPLRSGIANRYERLEDIGIYSAPVYKAAIGSTVESLTVIFYYRLYHIL